MFEFIAGVLVGLVVGRLAWRSRTGVAVDTAHPDRTPAISNTVDDLEHQVEMRKARARELKLLDLISKLAPEVARWPSWIKNDFSRATILRVVRSAEEVDGRVRLDVDGQVIDIGFKDHWFTTPDGDHHHHADATVFWQGSCVLDVPLAGSESYGFTSWKHFNSVDAFIEGPWINILRTIDEKHEASKKMEQESKRQAPERLAAMKRDFGIK